MKNTKIQAPDQSDAAYKAITEALFTSHGAITHATARLIAAAIHGGPGSALEELAATGRFDAAVVRREVDGLHLPSVHEPWRHALLAYLDAIQRRTHPWARSGAQRRPIQPSRREMHGQGPFA